MYPVLAEPLVTSVGKTCQGPTGANKGWKNYVKNLCYLVLITVKFLSSKRGDHFHHTYENPACTIFWQRKLSDTVQDKRF